MAAAFDWSPGGCCCILTGPWDFYQDGWDENEDESPTARGAQYFARTAAIYLQSDPPVTTITDYDSYDEWFVEIPDSDGGENFQHKVLLSSLAPLGIETSELVYFFMSDALSNHNQTKTWRFSEAPEDAEATEILEDAGESSHLTFDWADGAVYFERVTTDANTAENEFARSANDTMWEDWGVPSTAIMDSVELVSFRRKIETLTADFVSHSLAIRIVDDTGAAVLDADLYNAALPTSVDGGFVTVNVGAIANVLTTPTDFTASTSEIRLEIEYTLTSTSGTVGEKVWMDDIVLRFTHHGTTVNGCAGVDAENQAVDWVVPDAEWAELEWTDWEGTVYYGIGTIDYVQITHTGNTDYIAVPEGGSGVGADGVERWQLTAGNFSHWFITTAGDISFHYYNPSEKWQAANPSEYTSADPTYYGPPSYYFYDDGGPFGDDQMHVTPVNGYYKPIFKCCQSDYSVGIKYTPTSVTLPDDEMWDDLHNFDVDGGSISATGPYDVGVHVGFGPLRFDEALYDTPYVEAAHEWHSEETEQWSRVYYDIGIPDVDASVNHCIAVIRYRYDSDFDETSADHAWAWDYYEASQLTEKTVLVIDGEEIQNEDVYVWNNRYAVVGSGHYGEDEYPTSTDFRDYYPRWQNCRTLHSTETAQDGAQRWGVFARRPFDDSEVEDGVTPFDPVTPSYSSSALHQWRLDCYKSSGGTPTVDHAFTSRFGYTPATGTVLMDNGDASEFTIAAIPGGDADGELPNATAGTLGVGGNLVITLIDDTDEKAEFAVATNTLTVTIDITGEHDTIADLRQIINASGDFGTGDPGGTIDAHPIAASNEGEAEMTGGVSESNGDVGTYSPVVHDSSDRYYFVRNFPLKIYETRANGITGGTRRQVCTAGLINEPADYPWSWMISHDGTCANPGGSGTDRHQRAEPGPEQPPGTADGIYSSVKNSDLLPLCPAKELI